MKFHPISLVVLGGGFGLASCGVAALSALGPDAGDASMQPGADSASQSFLGDSDSGTIDSNSASEAAVACPASAASCPSSPPEAGAPCPGPWGLHCEYGDAPQSTCNTVAWCASGSGWLVQAPITDPMLCPTALSPACPLNYAIALQGGLACPLAGSTPGINAPVCVYPEGYCTCQQSGKAPA